MVPDSGAVIQASSPIGGCSRNTCMRWVCRVRPMGAEGGLGLSSLYLLCPHLTGGSWLDGWLLPPKQPHAEYHAMVLLRHSVVSRTPVRSSRQQETHTAPCYSWDHPMDWRPLSSMIPGPFWVADFVGLESQLSPYHECLQRAPAVFGDGWSVWAETHIGGPGLTGTVLYPHPSVPGHLPTR